MQIHFKGVTHCPNSMPVWNMAIRWLGARKKKFIFLNNACFRKVWSANLFNADTLSTGIKTGTKWLFPFPHIYAIFIDLTKNWSTLSRSFTRYWSIQALESASSHSSSWIRAGSPPPLPLRRVSLVTARFLSSTNEWASVNVNSLQITFIRSKTWFLSTLRSSSSESLWGFLRLTWPFLFSFVLASLQRRLWCAFQH